MGFSHILIAVAGALFAQIEVAPTDRAPYQADLLSISESSVELVEGNNRIVVPVEKLRWLRFDSSPKTTVVEGAPYVALTDDSRFSCSSVVMQSATARIELLAGNTLQMPARNLSQIQLQPLNDSQQSQWLAVANSRTSADILVLVRSAEALEKLEGIVLAISADAVKFDFAGQEIDVPLSKLAGIRFFSDENAAARTAKLAAIASDKSGNRWMAARVLMPSGSDAAELTLQCGAVIRLPLEQLREIDYSFGSMQFLAELEPIRTAARKRIELGIEIPGAAALFGPRPKDLRQPGSNSVGPSLEFLGSGSSVYRIPAGFSRLVGSVQLRPPGSRFTPCRVSIRLENKLLWQDRLAETGKQLEIDLPIQADQRLELSVEAESKTPVGDVVLWQDIRLVK